MWLIYCPHLNKMMVWATSVRLVNLLRQLWDSLYGQNGSKLTITFQHNTTSISNSYLLSSLILWLSSQERELERQKREKTTDINDITATWHLVTEIILLKHIIIFQSWFVYRINHYVTTKQHFITGTIWVPNSRLAGNTNFMHNPKNDLAEILIGFVAYNENIQYVITFSLKQHNKLHLWSWLFTVPGRFAQAISC